MVERDRFGKFLRGDWVASQEDQLGKQREVKSLVQALKLTGQDLHESVAEKIVQHGYYKQPEEGKQYPATADLLMDNPYPMAERRAANKPKKGQKIEKLSLKE